MDRLKIYNILYALIAKSGREDALFGNCGPIAREAFCRSLTKNAFPELWFEIPLEGEPWLDFHALTSYEDVADTQAAFAGHGGIYANALAWFTSQKPNSVRQLALSYDTSVGDTEHPAVQLLVRRDDAAVPLAFLKATGRPDLRNSYARFAGTMPPEWFACYVGVFPGRGAANTKGWVRVECIVGDKLQRAYANDAVILREHLTGTGMGDAPDNLIADVQELARSPFPLELQFNVGAGGAAMPALSASVRFQPVDWTNDASRAAIGALASWLQKRGLADGRCALLAQTAFAKRIEQNGKSTRVVCFPAFVKLRYRTGLSPDAKAYLMAWAE